MPNNVAVRLSTIGGAEVKNDFAQVKAAGTDAMKGIADSAVLAGDVNEQQMRRILSEAERLASEQEALDRRRARNADKMAMVSSQTDMQARIGAAVGTGFGDPTGTAKESAIVFAQLLAQEEQMEARANTLRAALDPLWAAQQRYNTEVAEARELMAAGAISADIYAQAELRAKASLDAATASELRHAQASGASRMAMTQLSYQAQDTFTQLSMGANIFNVLAIQGGQAAGAFVGVEGAAGGVARFMLGPWGLAITAGMLVLGHFTKDLGENEQAQKNVALASSGLGDAQAVLGQMFDLTTGKIKANTAELRLNAQVQSLILKKEANDALTTARQGALDAGQYSWSAIWNKNIPLAYAGRVHDTAARAQLMGVLNAKNAEDAATMASRAIDWAGKANFQNLDISREDFINAAVRAAEARQKQQNASLMDSTLTTGKLDPAFRRDDTKKPPKPKEDRHAEALARDSEATESLIASTLKLADAYAVSDAAALKAEVTGRAVAQGIKKQADTDLYVSQQLRLEVAKRTADGAKLLAGMDRETQRRHELNEQLLAGSITQDEANRTLRDEASLRPFLAAQALAEGDAKDKLTAIINGLRLANKAANDEDLRSRAGGYLADQRDRLEMADAELRLIGAGNAEHDRAIDKLRLMQQLDRDGIKAQSDLGAQILAGNDALQARTDMIRRANDAWEETKRIGEGFIDDVLDPSNWDDWGQMGKKVLADLMSDMIRLAAINPLKNLLFGENLPTLGGVASAFGKIGHSSDIAAAAGITVTRGGALGFASGTEYFAGGRARVGEFGPEDVVLPTGSKIMNASATRRAGNDNPAMHLTITNHIDATGADPAQLARTTAALEEVNKSIPSQVAKTFNEYRMRGILR